MLQKAAEARKQGKRLPEYDEKGELINPYIPMYISKAPCTYPARRIRRTISHHRHCRVHEDGE